MKGKFNYANKPPKQKMSSHINQTNEHINNNNFIWEKIYLNTIEEKENMKEEENMDNEYLSEFLKSSQSIHIKNYLYIFPLLKSDNKYAIIDLSKNILYFHKMPYQCFNPIYSPKYLFSIFLFYVDSSYKSDSRYNIIEFDLKNNSFNILNSKGVPPKERKYFSSFFYSNKIYFFGGLPQMLIDNSLNFIYSFNIKENEWKIEESYFMNEKGSINEINYLGNIFDNSSIQVNDKNIFYSIGGKYSNEFIFSEINTMGIEGRDIPKYKESGDIVKIIIKDDENIELSYAKIKNNKNILGKNCSAFYKDNIYLYNKDEMFLFDYKKNEINLLQKRIFAPEIEFKYYDDCYLFRTYLEKLDNKFKENKKIDFENIINNIKIEDNNNILYELNNKEENNSYLNKVILANISSNLRNILNNNKSQNKIIFNKINYQAFLIIIKWIYNNYEENISNLSNDNYKNIFNFFIKYKAKSLINIFISKININDTNALFLFELGNKHKLDNLSLKAHKYISEKIISKNNDKIFSLNETKEFKQKLFENYFCEHKLYIECMINNLEIRNNSNLKINNEQLENIKNVNKNGKLYYCINCCKVFIPNKEDAK